jgi:hypothetical protein
LSQEYVTSTFLADVINDLPDYPIDWNNNYYGWDYYDWGYYGYDYWGYWGGWYAYGYPWYGWWVADRQLSSDETSFEISKIQYKFTANPSAPTTIKWYDVFVPYDPSNPDPNQSQNIKIVAEHTWTLGPEQNECPQYEIDPSTRNDGNGYYTLMIEPAHLSTEEVGEAGKDIAGQETSPGQVILINDGDADNDGIPDYADGYSLDPTDDDSTHSYDSSFTPVWVTWGAMDPQNGKIKFTYDASDPMAVTRSGDSFPLPATGSLRIWTKDGWEQRNGSDLKQGGDYITSGVEYSLSDLGLDPDYYYYGGMTVYVEAVKLSNGVADLPVKVEVDPTGQLGYLWSDEIRFTATKIELRGKQYTEQDFSPVNLLINSDLNQYDPDTQTYQSTPDSYEIQRVRLYDPRTTAITKVKVGQTTLPVTSSGAGYLETNDFVCVQPGTTPQNWSGSATVVPMAAGYSGVQIEYNPFSAIDWLCGLFRSPDQAKNVQRQVDTITKQLHDDTSWMANYDPSDSGMFGKEVHKRVQAYFTGKAGWYSEVYVNKNTGRILSAGVPLDPSEIPDINNVMQIDLLYCKGGYKISTGARACLTNAPWETLNKSGLLFAAEIKTAARLSQPKIDAIVENYKAVTGLEKIMLADSEYVYKGGTVVYNKIPGRAIRMLGLVGGFGIASASILNAAVNIEQADAQLDTTIETVVRDRAIILDPSSNMYDVMAAKQEAGGAILQWMQLVIPNEVAFGLASLPSIRGLSRMTL